MQWLQLSSFLGQYNFPHLHNSVPLPLTVSFGLYHCSPALCPVTYGALLLEAHGPDTVYLRWCFQHFLLDTTFGDRSEIHFLGREMECTVNPALLFGALKAMCSNLHQIDNYNYLCVQKEETWQNAECLFPHSGLG